MNKAQEQVRDFHREVIDGPTSPAEPRVRNPELRASLILEEAIETAVALVGSARAQTIVQAQLVGVLQESARAGKGEPCLVDAIDGCMDLLYVAYGTCEDIGIDAEPFFDEVHRSNMAKRDPEGRQKISATPLGKKLKPPGWTPPDIDGVLVRFQNPSGCEARSKYVPSLVAFGNDDRLFNFFVRHLRGSLDGGLLARDSTREEKIKYLRDSTEYTDVVFTEETAGEVIDELDRRRAGGAP
jgi:predicted HAD superfamily Cof-like phosphohydrolase